MSRTKKRFCVPSKRIASEDLSLDFTSLFAGLLDAMGPNETEGC